VNQYGAKRLLKCFLTITGVLVDWKRWSKNWQHRYCCSTYWVAVEVPQEYHPAPRLQNTTRGHTMQFQRFQPVVDALKYAFLPRTIPDWNALPQLVAEADSLDTFKQHLSRHHQFWLSAFCTMHLVHICFTVHLFIAGFYTSHNFSPLLITVTKIHL